MAPLTLAVAVAVAVEPAAISVSRLGPPSTMLARLPLTAALVDLADPETAALATVVPVALVARAELKPQY